MFSDSVLARTGQLWKLAIAVLALVIGSVAPAFPATGMSWTVGTVLAIAGYAFGVWAIRCPSCGQRWFWIALLDGSLYKPLFTRAECPSCGTDFARPENAKTS